MAIVCLNKDNDKDDYIEIPKLVADNDCVLENFVTGEEVWFDIFAFGQVPQLKALDGLLNAYFKNETYHRTYLQGNYFNLICVSSQGQCYFSYKGEKLDRRSAGGPYKETFDLDSKGTTFDHINTFSSAGPACFSIGDTMCAVNQTGGDHPTYWLTNVDGVELSSEPGYATIMEFCSPHDYMSIHVGGANLGVFAGFYFDLND